MAEPFDMSLVQRGARNRRTPYYEATQKYAPKGFTVYNHMYFPIRFDTFENEFETLLNDVTLWDVAVERCLEISGPDGFTFAQLMTPRDLSKCAVGQAKYVLVVDSDGGIINDPVLTRMDENTFWFALASSDTLLWARGLKNAYPELDVTIREADVAPLQVQGPKSKDLMVDLLGESILELKYYWWRNAEIAGVPVVVTRTGWTSEVGYEVYLTGHDPRDRGLRGADEGRRAVQHQAHRPVGHPSDRGRHLQLGRRHDVREQPDRDRLRPAHRVGPGRRGVPFNRRTEGHPRGRGESAHQRGRAGWRSVPGSQQREVGGRDRRRPRRQGHVGDPLASPREEHRILLAADGQEHRGTDGDRRNRVGNPDRHRRLDAVRRPGEDDPHLLSAPTARFQGVAACLQGVV